MKFIHKPLLYLIIGFASAFLIQFFYSEQKDGKLVTFLQEFEINDYSPNSIDVKGTYINSVGDLHIVSIDCRLETNLCTETPVFVTSNGITGIVGPKVYSIIEKSPTRIVARYDGLSAYHMYTIDIATKKVTFKAQSNSDSTDVEIYELQDGNESLKELNH